MRTHDVHFYSEGARVAGLWRTPDRFDGRRRAIVQGPGWLGLKDAQLYLRYHEALTAAGFVVLIFDYRGFGDSEGEPTVSPYRQLQDLRNAVTYLETRDDVDPDALGVFGSGSTGAGNAVLLAATDRRVRAAVSQLPVADGGDWLRRVKADVDSRVPLQIPLAAADEILEYRPLAAAQSLTTPLLVIAVEHDTTTPADHAIALYEAAKGPRELIIQRHTSHYASYDANGDAIAARIVEWFDRHLTPARLVVRSRSGPE